VHIVKRHAVSDFDHCQNRGPLGGLTGLEPNRTVAADASAADAAIVWNNGRMGLYLLAMAERAVLDNGP
jgi:hypothetical protein